METKTKVLIVSIVAALTAILAALGVYLNDGAPSSQPSPLPSVSALPSPLASVAPAPSTSPLPSPKPSPTPSPTPSATPSASAGPASGVFIVEGFERPEFAAAWVKNTSRTILDGQVTSFVLKTDSPCVLVGTAGLMKMVPVLLNRPSAPTYSAGVYYDALMPLTSLNCQGTKYLQIDAAQSISIGDAKITVVKKATKAPVTPAMPLHVELNNWTAVKAYGSTTSKGTDVLPAIRMLNAHRVSPYKGQEVHSLSSWETFVKPFALGGSVFLDSMGFYSWVGINMAPTNSWGYVVDEPQIGNTAQISQDLMGWLATGAKPMMTAPLRQRDYRPTLNGATNPNFAKLVDWPSDIKAGIKIWVPVAEQFCLETWANSKDFYPCAADYVAANKDLWLYVSNMSHGNEGGGASGAPDLVIDRSAVEAFGFFGLGIKYGAKGLLYYNSIQGWDTQDVLLNPYQFGGNGDGLALYPDKVNKQAFASIRLKLWREASAFADLVKIAGLQADVSALMVSPINWTHDLSKFEAIRTKALGLIP